FCVVSTDAECNPPHPTNCIYKNVEYRFRVSGPVKGYLRVVGNEVKIVPDFLQASGLNLHNPPSSALRVGYKDHTGMTLVFSIPRAGHPIVIEEPVPNKYSQWIALEKTSSRKGRFDLW
ncbi:hypothetical protein CPC16_003665, partial [Podila verticillata]